MLNEHNLDNDGKFKTDQENKQNLTAEELSRLEKIDVYYKEAGTLRFVPRAVCVDLEPGTAEVIKASPIGKMFKPDNFIFGASGAGNNWCVALFFSRFALSTCCWMWGGWLGPRDTTLKGMWYTAVGLSWYICAFFVYRAEIIDEVLDVVRQEAEACDCPQVWFGLVWGGWQ